MLCKLKNLSRLSVASGRFFHSSVPSLAQVPFLLADIGEGIAEVEVLQWHVKEGDMLSQFDMVCEVQSDKANVDISSRFDGRVVSLQYKVGDMAKVGSPLIIIDTDGGGDTKEEKEEIKHEENPKKMKEAPKESIKEEVVDDASMHESHSLATPAVRRIAMENKVNLTKIKGTGKDGRVMKEDILSFIANKGSKPLSKPPTINNEQPSVNHNVDEKKENASTPLIFTSRAEDKIIPVRGMTRLMVSSMKASLVVPHFGYCDEYIFDNLALTREMLKPIAKEKGIKLSFMPFVIKATSMALQSYPILNSSLSQDESQITMHGSHNIGVAMDTPRGLLVPCISHVQEKSIFDIAQELSKLQELGAVNKLGEKELKGTTFSLSNIGAIGGTYAKPVIVPPQVAIGALGKIQTLPRYDEKMNVIPTKLVQFSWAADHRVIDGATMARFSNQLKDYLENPGNMLGNLK